MNARLKTHAAPRSARAAGRATLILLAVLAAAAALVVAILLPGGDRPREPGALEPGAVQPGALEPDSVEPADTAPARGGDALRPAGGDGRGRTADGAPPAVLPPDGRPVGILRGQVEVPQGVTLPERWTLVLEPSRFVAGAEHAEERRVEVTGSKTFELEGLPLAGYDVYPTAEGFTSRRAPVLLHPGREQVYVVLQMERAALVDGRVLDADGSVVAGLAITLETPDTRRRTTVRTDHAGFFRFDAVADGDYRLLVGPPDAPVLAPRTVAVRPPSLAVPTIEVPVLETLRLTVTDAIGTPLAGVRVRGSGDGGGYVDDVSDSRGELLAPLLPPGRYRLRAAHDGVGRGFVTVDLVAGRGEQRAVLELAP